MTIRQDMLGAVSQARNLLAESAAGVVAFIQGQLDEDGGFKGRNGRSDLYYTLFGLEALVALGADVPAGRVAEYLRGFGDGDSLDLVHTASLIRCWADVATCRAEQIPADLRARLLARIEDHRCRGGGYGTSDRDRRCTVYGCFLALGALQDLGAEPSGDDGIAECLESLRAADGGYSNEPGMQAGTTPATAAALAILHYLGKPIPDEVPTWLLGRLHPAGGFVASPALAEYGIPDLLSTATALHSLTLAGVPTGRFREQCLDFLDSLWSSEGGFAGSWADPTLDCEYTYYGLLVLGNLAAAPAGPGA